MNLWKKVEGEKGIPLCYLGNTLSQFEHPKFADIKQRLDDCNYVKYSSYRVALKMKTLQHSLYMEQVPLSIISGVFERHRLGVNENSLSLDSYDLEAVLSDIYFASNKQNHINTDVDCATELMLNLLFNIFDRNRVGKIKVLEVKLLLGVLSKNNLEELYRFLFSLCADHNNCMTRLKLQILLTKCTALTKYMHEDSSFGEHLIHEGTEQCFKNSPGLVGINESAFISWLDQGTQLFIWLPILNRLKLAQMVIHNAKCSSCNLSPIIGLCYRCTKCSKYLQCQRCFFVGRLSHSHKLSHSMKEFYTEINNRENNYFVKRFFGFLPCSNNLNNTQKSIIPEISLSCKNRFHGGTQEDELCNIEPMSSPISQLQVIIKQLELQNRELQHILSTGTTNEKEFKIYLEQHRKHVAREIQKLKILKEHFKPPNVSKSTKIETKTESTPLVRNGKIRERGLDFYMMSPIAQTSETVIGLTNNMSVTPLMQSNRINGNTTVEDKSLQFSLNDLSTWIGGNPTVTSKENSLQYNGGNNLSDNEIHRTDLDDALAKLQQILANNLSLDESLGNIDNAQLKYTVSEVEGMLTSFIDTVECSKGGSLNNDFEFV